MRDIAIPFPVASIVLPLIETETLIDNLFLVQQLMFGAYQRPKIYGLIVDDQVNAGRYASWVAEEDIAHFICVPGWVAGSIGRWISGDNGVKTSPFKQI